jgi:hypothetical protein
MKVAVPYACNICNVLKKPSNRWYRCYLHIELTPVLVVLHWDSMNPVGMDQLSVENADAHLCGIECLHQWISKNLG